MHYNKQTKVVAEVFSSSRHEASHVRWKDADDGTYTGTYMLSRWGSYRLEVCARAVAILHSHLFDIDV